MALVYNLFHNLKINHAIVDVKETKQAEETKDLLLKGHYIP